MSKRLQVIMPDEEMEEIKRAAAMEKLTVGEWVRRGLRQARERSPRKSIEEKLRAVRELASLNLGPVPPDVRQMNREIEEAKLSDFPAGLP